MRERPVDEPSSCWLRTAASGRSVAVPVNPPTIGAFWSVLSSGPPMLFAGGTYDEPASQDSNLDLGVEDSAAHR
jgi:hypothetical protein